MMISPALLRSLFQESYNQIKTNTEKINHSESLRMPDWSGNSMHWIVGHIVVSRCNFLLPLDIPSIWEWSVCKLFIPGSKPTTDSYNHIDFVTILADLERTQTQLMDLLSNISEADLQVIKEDKTIAEQLTTYAAHEFLSCRPA